MFHNLQSLKKKKKVVKEKLPFRIIDLSAVLTLYFEPSTLPYRTGIFQVTKRTLNCARFGPRSHFISWWSHRAPTQSMCVTDCHLKSKSTGFTVCFTYTDISLSMSINQC